MSYISCSACAKTLLLFYVYEQRLYYVFAMYVLAMHVNQYDNAKNRSIYCIIWACKCTKAESCLCSMYVCDVYELQSMRKDVAVILCIWAKTVSCFYNVYICDACKSIRKSIYCITQACRCAKVELCLCSICMCDVYELQRMRKDVAVVLCIWAKTMSCLRSVCDCAACTSIW